MKTSPYLFFFKSNMKILEIILLNIPWLNTFDSFVRTTNYFPANNVGYQIISLKKKKIHTKVFLSTLEVTPFPSHI